jgi:hypothetical protein
MPAILINESDAVIIATLFISTLFALALESPDPENRKNNPYWIDT